MGNTDVTLRLAIAKLVASIAGPTANSTSTRERFTRCMIEPWESIRRLDRQLALGPACKDVWEKLHKSFSIRRKNVDESAQSLAAER